MKSAYPPFIFGSMVISSYGVWHWNRAKKKLKLTEDMPEKDINLMFDEIDRDKSGTIDMNELGDYLHSRNHHIGTLSLNAMIRCADENGDGEVDKVEWLHMLKGDSKKWSDQQIKEEHAIKQIMDNLQSAHEDIYASILRDCIASRKCASVHPREKKLS